MSDGLVLLEDVDRDRALLERARSFALSAEQELHVLILVDRDEYNEAADTLETIGQVEHTTYDEGAILDAIAGDVANLAEDVLGDEVEFDVRVETTADENAERLIAVAEEAGCDHVFVSGRQRSPAGKALFGDRTQQLILNFDGFVTVATE